jgi:signal transduction histidine kinase
MMHLGESCNQPIQSRFMPRPWYVVGEGFQMTESASGESGLHDRITTDLDENVPFESVLSRLVRRALPSHGPEAFKHLQILDRTSSQLAEAGLDLQAILHTITRHVASLGVDLCVIRLLSEDGEWLVPAASYHPDPEAEPLIHDILTVPQRADEGLQGYVVQSNEALLIPSLADEEMRAIVKPHWWTYLERFGIHSILVVPLRARNRVLGGLGVFRSTFDQAYTYDDQVLVQELADRAAMAIDNTRLFEQLTDREQRLQELVGRLLLSQEEERRKVAYDVHDGLAQVAASAHQHLQAFAFQFESDLPEAQAQLARCLELARQTIREARRVISNLRPTALDDFGLAAAVRLQIEQLSSEGWDIDYTENLGERRLPPPIETALFRIVQEALNNVHKHAGSTRALVSLMAEDGRVHLIVRDWGNGFEPDRLSGGTSAGERVGLPGMKERAALIGGTCIVASRPGEGTIVQVDVPLLGVGIGEPE